MSVFVLLESTSGTQLKKGSLELLSAARAAGKPITAGLLPAAKAIAAQAAAYGAD